jgi:hypothetical protein
MKRNKKGQFVGINLTKNELQDLYLIQKKPIKEIGKILNINGGSIYPFLKKYNIPKRDRPHIKGEKHFNWKGGKVKATGGYILIYSPTHPYSQNTGYVLEHRLIMEAFLKRYLAPEEIVDHKNGIKDDNRIENLKLFSHQSEHIKEEKQRGVYIGTHINQKRNERGMYI